MPDAIIENQEGLQVIFSGVVDASGTGIPTGIPAGGSTGQVLSKNSATDFDTTWSTGVGVPDGDKGDILVSGSGTNWTIENIPESATVTSGTYLSNANQSLLIKVRKSTAGTITKGQVVYIVGSTGNHLTVELARANAEATSAYTIGIAATTITGNADGFIMQYGRLTALSTLPTASFADGNAIYLSEATAGGYRVGPPIAPNHGVLLGFVIRANNGSAGELDVRIQNYQELDELSDVNIVSAAANDLLIRNATNTRWENTTPANVKTVLAINNVDNTSDANKPVSTATQTALDNLELKTRIRNAGLLNGFILPTVVSNNLILSISTSASSQVNPTASSPVYVWINGVLRTISSALTVTANAGTNWFASGSAELATQQIDYFAYMGYNATDGVVLGYARIPYARLYSDFSATSTNEKFARISTITNAVAGDNYVNVGRFAATLSATAAFNWTVPTFTTANLIQEPVYETRDLDFIGDIYGLATRWTIGNGTRNVSKYTIKGNQIFVTVNFTIGSTTSLAGGVLGLGIPFQSLRYCNGNVWIQDGGNANGAYVISWRVGWGDGNYQGALAQGAGTQVTSTSPVALGVGDQLGGSVNYYI